MDTYIEDHHWFLKTLLSPMSYQEEKYILPELSRYLASLGVLAWHEVTREHLESWLTHLTEVKKNSVRSRVKKIHAARRFFTWMEKEGYLLASPIDKEFYRPKITKHLRQSPSLRAALGALESAEGCRRFPRRNRAILELAYGTGLRLSEIYSLNVRDIAGDEVRVMGKGGKERLVPLGEEARKHLLLYIRTERQKTVSGFNPFEEALFVSQYGTRLCRSGYHALLKRQVKIPYSLHSFRHACATHMLRGGANIRAVQKLLGHKRLSTTQDYTHVDTGHVKEMLGKFHPRG